MMNRTDHSYSLGYMIEVKYSDLGSLLTHACASLYTMTQRHEGSNAKEIYQRLYTKAAALGDAIGDGEAITFVDDRAAPLAKQER